MATTTYGKKKRSLLPSFSVLRDSEPIARSRSKKDKPFKRGSISHTFSPNPPEGSISRDSPPPASRDDSIDEMASMLLDEAPVERVKPGIGKRLSLRAAKALPRLPRLGAQDEKSLPEEKNLPQLPKLVFNGDDAWAMKASTVVTAAGSANQMDFSDDPLQLDSPVISPSSTNHVRKSSAPPIPRKSSKRRSGRPKGNMHKSQGEANDQPKDLITARQSLKNNISLPQPAEVTPSTSRSSAGATDINEKIEAMMAATRALKPGSDGGFFHGPLIPTKKKGLMESKMLTRMKSAINDHFQARGNKKRDSVRDGRLLDKNLGELPEFDEDASALTAVELRMNEGDNFKNPKIFNLTGHGNVRRKPLADDGKSLRSRKSVDDPFSERPSSNGTRRTPTKFEHRLKDDSSFPPTDEYIPELPPLKLTPKNQVSKQRMPKVYSSDADFDALISSSPIAQSTPRIRLEPSFEDDGKKVLKKVPSDSRSLFDSDQINPYSDTDFDVEQADQSGTISDSVKRKMSDNKGVKSEVRHHSKKMKKHPSPSKAELEGLERAMANFPSLHQSESFSNQDDRGPISLGKVSSRLNALAPKDANKKIRLAKRTPLKPEMTVASMPVSTSNGIASQKLATQPESVESKSSKARSPYSNQNSASNDHDNMMDIDELQWDIPAYNIGGGRRI